MHCLWKMRTTVYTAPSDYRKIERNLRDVRKGGQTKSACPLFSPLSDNSEILHAICRQFQLSVQTSGSFIQHIFVVALKLSA